MKMAESYQKEKKTPLEKKKLVVTSNFSFFHSVFKRLVLQTCKNQGLFGKELKKKLIPVFERHNAALHENPKEFFFFIFGVF